MKKKLCLYCKKCELEAKNDKIYGEDVIIYTCVDGCGYSYYEVRRSYNQYDYGRYLSPSMSISPSASEEYYD